MMYRRRLKYLNVKTSFTKLRPLLWVACVKTTNEKDIALVSLGQKILGTYKSDRRIN